MDLTSNLFKGKELSIEDLSYLRKLMETDLPLSFCMELLQNSRNERIFKQISDSLAKGKMIEEIIGDYLPAKIKSYILPLLGHFSFKESLSLSLDFYFRQSESSDKLINEISYPCILLFVTITALYLFDLYGLDSIFALIRNFDGSVGIYEDIRLLFRVFIRFFYWGMLMAVMLAIYFFSRRKISYLYLFMSKHFPSSLISIYYSEEFVSLLLICVSMGYGSRKSLEILKKMKNKPIVSLLAFHMDEALLNGESLKNAAKQKYYDYSLSRFIKIAAYADDFKGVLGSYTALARTRIRYRMKLYSRTIQVVTYAIIGLIIIFIYQILFMPMQAISMF